MTNEIKSRMRRIGRDTGHDVVLVEVGGTVGDIEGQPFLEAIRQMRNEEAREDTLAIHVTFLPFISPTGELKTKPTHHSANCVGNGVGSASTKIDAWSVWIVSGSPHSVKAVRQSCCT